MRDHIIGAVGSRLAKLCPAKRPDVALYDMCRWRSRMENSSKFRAKTGWQP